MRRLLFYTLLFSFAFTGCRKNKISEWRGVNRSGVYLETGLKKQWPENGPEILWSVDSIGNGYVAPAVTDDALYVTGEIDSLAHLYKYKLDGTLLWDIIYDKEWVKWFRGVRSHPTVVNDRIYLGSGMGNLFCISTNSGEILWSKKFVDDFQGEYPYFGHSEAPAVDENKVYWTPGGQKYNVVAMDRFTGDVLWYNEGFKERSAYNSPVLVKHHDRKILLTFSAYHLLAVDAETGELIWGHEQTNKAPEKRKPGYGDTHANTVLYDNGMIYYAEGDGNGGVKLQLSDDGNKITQIWNNKRFDSYMGGIVKLGTNLYGCGSAKPRLYRVDASSGEITDSLKIGSGVVISSDSMIYYYNYKGEVHLIDYIGDKMAPVSLFRVIKGSKEHFSHPVIRKGVLYIRHGNSLLAYNLKNDS